MSSLHPRHARALLTALAATALAALPSLFAGSASAATPAAKPAAHAVTLPTVYVSQDRKLFITVANVHGTPTVGVVWLSMPTTCVGGATPKTLLVASAPLIDGAFRSAVISPSGDIKFVEGQIRDKTITGVAKVSYTTAEQGFCSTKAQSFTASTR